MTNSMTAFARKEHRGDAGELAWELRSVNHRYLEVGVRLPEEFRVLETAVRERVAKHLSRGKVDCTLRLESAVAGAAGVRVNKEFAQQIIAATEEVNRLLHETLPPRAMEILRWPGVVEVEKPDFTPLQQQALELQLLEQPVDCHL